MCYTKSHIMRLSQKLADFNTEINSSIPYFTTAANVTRLKIDGQIVIDAAAHLADWNTKWGLYSNPVTHTEQSVFDINAAYAVVHPFIEGVKKMLKNSVAITLSGA